MATRGKKKSAVTPQTKSKWAFLSNRLFQIFLTAFLTFAFAYLLYLLTRSGPPADEIITAVPSESHTYSFDIQGRRISGESIAPFERGQGYYARIEACQLFGVEGIMNIASCYMTIRITENMTISNSENYTEAVYSDGSSAHICCMAVDNDFHDALYRIRIPPGSSTRRTYQRGGEIHLMLNIPDADPGRRLDAIRFSPGEGAAPILFAIGDRIENRVFSRSFIDAHRDDPAIQRVVADAVRMKAETQSREEANRGLTYNFSN